MTVILTVHTSRDGNVWNIIIINDHYSIIVCMHNQDYKIQIIINSRKVFIILLLQVQSDLSNTMCVYNVNYACVCVSACVRIGCECDL